MKSLNKKERANSRILLHTDAAQTIGKVKVDVNNLGVDYLTIVGQKVRMLLHNLNQSQGMYVRPWICELFGQRDQSRQNLLRVNQNNKISMKEGIKRAKRN